MTIKFLFYSILFYSPCITFELHMFCHFYLPSSFMFPSSSLFTCLINTFPFLPSTILRHSYLFASSSSFLNLKQYTDFPDLQLLKQNSIKIPFFYPPSFLLRWPFLFCLGILWAAGLITGCHKRLMFSQKKLAALRGAAVLLAGKWQLHLQANRVRRERCEGDVSFDWTVIVICGSRWRP